MMRTFNLRRRDIPLGLAVSGWLVLGITAIAGHNLIRPLAVFAFALVIATVAGCGGGKSKGTIPFTPVGTFTLTVQGSAQNGARGYTCTLIVASGT